MKNPLRYLERVFVPTALGALGGFLNALLCYKGWPPVPDFDPFHKTIFLAGALHGAIIAFITLILVIFCRERNIFWKTIGLILSGYLSGWFSYIPIYFSEGFKPGWSDLLWPFGRTTLEAFYTPYQSFGFVGSIYFLLLVQLQFFYDAKLTRHMFVAIVSAVLGSLWWWISFKVWYLSLLHGAIWGALVGYGVWHSQKSKYWGF